MKKEWTLMLAVIAVTVVVSIGMIRWLAPALLGGPSDLQLVRVDEKVPPFYKGVFRDEHSMNEGLLIKDPLTRVRGRQFYLSTTDYLGPNDILGFRNKDVPVIADIITIGDSMTYGNNAAIEKNLPGYLSKYINRDDTTIYNMSMGGWGAVQYFDMFTYAINFRPRVVIIAFYTGNDSLESFAMVYGNEYWSWLMPDKNLTKADGPRTTAFPPPESGWWDVSFKDGVHTVFTPHYRLNANREHPAVKAGYAVMINVAKLIAEKAIQLNIKPVFTIIPTKELVYEKKIIRERLQEPDEYINLVKNEMENLKNMEQHIKVIPGAEYIDVLTPLQNAALEAVNLYREDINGHPIAKGYEVIGKSIAGSIETMLPDPLCGLFALTDYETNQIFRVLINKNGVWYFNSVDLIEQNGWPAQSLPNITMRDIWNLPELGMIKTVDKEIYGPSSCDRNITLSKKDSGAGQ